MKMQPRLYGKLFSKLILFLDLYMYIYIYIYTLFLSGGEGQFYREVGAKGEGSGGRGGGKWGQRGREVGIRYPPVNPLSSGLGFKGLEMAMYMQ